MKSKCLSKCEVGKSSPYYKRCVNTPKAQPGHQRSLHRWENMLMHPSLCVQYSKNQPVYILETASGGEGLSPGREELAGVLQNTNALGPLSAQQGTGRPQTLNSSTSERSSSWLIFGVLYGQDIEDWRQDTAASLCLLEGPVDYWTCPAGQ